MKMDEAVKLSRVGKAWGYDEGMIIGLMFAYKNGDEEIRIGPGADDLNDCPNQGMRPYSLCPTWTQERYSKIKWTPADPKSALELLAEQLT